MPTIESSAGHEERIDEAELAAAAFLARYQGRTMDAYRHDIPRPLGALGLGRTPDSRR